MTAVAKRTVVVGVGLLGASLAAGGRRAGVLSNVVGVGRSQENLDVALRSGCIDESSTNLELSLKDADLVVLAAPADTCVTLLARVAAAAPARAIVTDVASVKLPLVLEAVRLGIDDRFVGAHPMAGNTSTGAGAADPDLFRARTVVVTPTPRTGADALARIEQLWRALGAQVELLDADLHDRVVALSSHLPQMLATALAAQLGAEPQRRLVTDLAGGGLRDTTRIAMSDARMWSAIASANRDYLLAAMDRFTRSWARLRSAVAHGDTAALETLLEEGADFRRTLEGR